MRFSNVYWRFFDRVHDFNSIRNDFLKNPPVNDRQTSLEFVRLHQVHGNRVLIVDRSNLQSESLDADALVTAENNMALTIHTADCLPLLASDGRVIGACHGGWRGVVAGVIENWIAAFLTLGTKIENLEVSFGPSIGPCHFEVGTDVGDKICSTFENSNILREEWSGVRKPHPDPLKVFIDLQRVAVLKLIALGVQPPKIITSPECTFCHSDRYFSFRRDGGTGARLESLIVKSQL